MFRSLARRVTGASRSQGRRREGNDIGEDFGPLAMYDRSAAQHKTVSKMLHVMREAGFLNAEHRGSDWITNVFCNPKRRLASKLDQERLLGITEHGRLKSALHASVHFPDVFGGLSSTDIKEHFAGKKFKSGPHLEESTPSASLWKNTDRFVSALKR